MKKHQKPPVECSDCKCDITHKIQYYDWIDKTKQMRIVRCERCAWRIKETI